MGISSLVHYCTLIIFPLWQDQGQPGVSWGCRSEQLGLPAVCSTRGFGSPVLLLSLSHVLCCIPSMWQTPHLWAWEASPHGAAHFALAGLGAGGNFLHCCVLVWQGVLKCFRIWNPLFSDFLPCRSFTASGLPTISPCFWAARAGSCRHADGLTELIAACQCVLTCLVWSSALFSSGGHCCCNGLCSACGRAGTVCRACRKGWHSSREMA